MIVPWRHHIVAAFIGVVFVAPLIWMLADRQEPYVRIAGTISPQNPAPGDFVEVRWALKVNRWCPTNTRRNVTRTVIDAGGKIHDYDSVEGVFGADRDRQSTPQTLTRGFQLPKDIAPGPARYQSTACFACNPTQHLWPVCIRQPAIYFQVRGEPVRPPK